MSRPMATPSWLDDSSYLTQLNEEQRQAVEALDKALLILSGAGTGKTRVLTTRIAHLIHSQNIFPNRILAVTFTNKAAHEMNERVESILGLPSKGLWIGTFHSIGVRILRHHGEKIGLAPNFNILGPEDDQLRLVKQLIKDNNIDEKRWAPRMVTAIINRWKDRGLMPTDVTPLESGYSEIILKIYHQYQERLKTYNAVDFGDLLLQCLTLFKTSPETLDYYHRQFHHILVDEYQDTNVAQYLWLRLLAQGGAHICCVGDDDQSIYGWRGAEVENILRFESDFSQARVIRLEQNYRSTPAILGAASSLITYNKGRMGKKLWTQQSEGDKVEVHSLWDGSEEAEWVAQTIKELDEKEVPLSKIAILVRASFQTREFEEKLLAYRVPYKVVGGPRFYERLEIRDALAYLRLLHQLSDNLAFERIINVPKRGVGTSTLHLFHEIARNTCCSLFEAVEQALEQNLIKGKTHKSLSQFTHSMRRWISMKATLPHHELAQTILEEGGYIDFWRSQSTLDAAGRMENLKELVSVMAKFSDLQTFLEHVSLVMDNITQRNESMASIMTLHSAKGLEFDYVFLCGWEEGLFPHQRALDEKGMEGLEEERRLAYVGLTRARKKAIITHAFNRRVYNLWQSYPPSRFIEEIDQEYVTQNHHSMKGNNLHRNSLFSPAAGKASEKSLLQSEDAFLPGMRIFHEKFGYGIVKAISANHVTIDFEFSGKKTILLDFIKPA